VNAILLLTGLLVLSYIGSFLVGGRTIRGVGLPSGSEYVALGFMLGPVALGLFGRGMIEEFQPIAHVALGWLAFVIGLDFGKAGDRRARPGPMAVGVACGLVTGAVVGAAAWYALGRLRGAPEGLDRILLAGGLGAACTETTRHAMRWVIERYRARGKLTTFLDDFAHADDFVPLLALAVLFSLRPMYPVPMRVSLAGWIGITIGLGFLLGGIAALHIGREFRIHQTWGVLLGTSLLGIGVAARLELSILTVMFFMGLSTALLSKHRDHIRQMVAPTERPVLLPALVLAGARLDPRATGGLVWIIGIALLARIAGKVLVGTLIRIAPAARPASASLGFGLLSSGALAMSVGLSYAMRFPGKIGDTVLLTAAVITVFGEFVGPITMRQVLRRAGEIVEPAEDSGPPAEKEEPQAVTP
jgi:hypothetical protein